MLSNKIYAVISFLIASLLIFYNLHFYLSVSKVGTDSVSWLLPAKAIVEKSGLPYKDYWDTKPIGLILFSSVWIDFFGDSLASFRLLHFIMVVIVVYGVMRFLNYIYERWISFVLFMSFLISFMSPLTQTQPLLIELYGMSFSVLAINILISKFVPISLKIFGSSLMFILAAQMKESYAFIAISILPFVFKGLFGEKKKFFKVVSAGFLGVSIPILIFVMFMIKNDIVTSYVEVVDFIINHNSPSTFSQAINLPKNTFVYLQYRLELFLLTIAIVYFYLSYIQKDFIVNIKKNMSGKMLRLKLFLPKINERYLFAVLYSLGAAIGFKLQNKFGSHYNAQMILPTIIIISIPLVILYEKISLTTRNIYFKKLGPILLLSLLIVLLFPKKQYFLSFDLKTLNYEYTKYIYDLSTSPDLLLENRIRQLTDTNECILHVYGWGVGTTYFYSDRKPCSRFFLVNLLPKNFYDEYRNELVINPPKVVYYSLAGADIDNIRFEKEVFNFPAVLNKCYVKDKIINGLYIAGSNDIRKCISKYK